MFSDKTSCIRSLTPSVMLWVKWKQEDPLFLSPHLRLIFSLVGSNYYTKSPKVKFLELTYINLIRHKSIGPDDISLWNSLLSA